MWGLISWIELFKIQFNKTISMASEIKNLKDLKNTEYSKLLRPKIWKFNQIFYHHWHGKWRKLHHEWLGLKASQASKRNSVIPEPEPVQSFDSVLLLSDSSACKSL